MNNLFPNSFQEASKHGNIQVLEWLKNSGYKLKYSKYTISLSCSESNFENILFDYFMGRDVNKAKKQLSTKNARVLYFFIQNINVKKVIKWSYPSKFIKSNKFKTKNNYMKGYYKN